MKNLTKADREILSRAIEIARRHWEGERQNYEVIADWPPNSAACSPENAARKAKSLARLIARLDAAMAKLDLAN